MALLDKDFCIQKIDLAIDLIERLIDGDHPHDDSKKALEQLRVVYQNDRDLLLSLDNTAKDDTVLEFCRRANVNLVRLKEFVGFLLRSTNIRNAFELYFPIRLLATELLGKPAPVILGSEWNFSPYTYPAALSELPDFIFIGIPASECQNPLILPLAGHELGHVVWRRQGAGPEFDVVVRAMILELYKAHWDEFKKNVGLPAAMTSDTLDSDLLLRSIWARSYELARRQLEELFCDFLGVYIFGESFLQSFRYLVAPSLGRTRIITYPKIRDRAKYMLEYAHSIGVEKIAGFEDVFSEADKAQADMDAFILKIADEATAKLNTQLPALVNKYRGGVQVCSAGAADRETAFSCLSVLVPPTNIKSIAAIVNAAWKIRLGLDKWPILSEISDPEKQRPSKLRVLMDIVLKSFEVYEYQKRVDRDAA